MLQRLLAPTRWCLLAFVFFAAGTAAEGSFLERVGEFVGNVERTASDVARVIGESKPTTPPEQPPPPLPDNLPEHWQVDYVREPVFGSNMLVAETGVSNEKTVILVHGLGPNGLTDWRKIIPALEERYHVIAFDLPGFGRSDNPGGRYSPTRYARMIHWLVEQNGRERVHLVGHSMGGAVVLRYASSFPERVDRVALASVAGVLERTAFMKHAAELPLDASRAKSRTVKRATSQVESWGNRLVELASTTLPDPTAILKHSNVAWRALLTDRPSINAALSLIEEDFSAALAQLDAPVLVLWGTQDRVAPPRTGTLLAARLKHARLSMIEGADHPLMHSHPATFNDRLLAFLDSETVPSGTSPIPAKNSPRQGDLVCRGETGTTYSGHYQSVILDNCSSVQLNKVRAERIMILNSRVTMEHVAIESEGTALQIEGSSLTVTDGHFSGTRGIVARSSTLDLAGVTIEADQRAVVAREGSRFVFSVSEVQDPHYSGHVHGAYQLADGSLQPGADTE